MTDRIVETTSGKVRGYERDGRIDFLGIPYAKAPVGELRFKRSLPVTPWGDVLDAKDYGSAPVQYNNGVVMGQEDCLRVNVQRPIGGENLPVFIWIYGGGYNTGYSHDEMYTGEAFVRDGVLFFSFNYRTNILGFYDFTTFPGCEDFESNCGLSDQILALNWIRANVEAFGGDPNRITIAGESAGGASVVNMLACPGVKGCFTQAIVESGLPNCVMTHQMARENIELFLEGMHWTEKDLGLLRTMDPHMFLLGHEYVQAKHQYKNPGMFLPGPVLDDLLPQRPIDAIRGGSAKGIKLIIGTNQHEGTMFVHPKDTGFPNSWSMITQMLEKNKNILALPQIVNFYHGSGEEAFIRFATDYAFEMPSLKVALGAKQYCEDVWMYRFELVTKAGTQTGWKASHAFELPFVFEKPDHPFTHFLFDGESQELFAKMAGELHGDWVRFVKEGAPNPDWARFQGADSKVRIYDRQTRTEELDRRQLLEVWGDLRFYE